MTRFIIRRLALMPVVLLLANFLGFAYAYYVAPIQAAANPYSFGGFEVQPLLPQYLVYLKSALTGDFGFMPTNEPIASILLRSCIASIGLLAISSVLSVILGISMGLTAVKMVPTRISGWLTWISTVGLAAPSFYIGVLLISGSVLYLIYGIFTTPLLPFQGFGWDAHLVLPVIALMVQPTVKIAQVTSSMLVDEFGKQYIVVARSMGHPLRSIRQHFAFRNILAPVIIIIAGSLRFMVAELIIIERLFDWPGLGRLFSTTLVLTSHSNNLLLPPLLAALMTVLALFYLIVDLVASILVRTFDPRVERA
jgi:peptide/nickel transport system permease protein